MNKRTFLEGLGYGFLVLYVGRQQTDLTYARGQQDGDNAVDLAIAAGFTTAVIYLDIEAGGGSISQALLNYINGWLDKVDSFASWYPGIYCSYSQNADQIKNSRPNMSIRFWVWRLSAPSPGCTTAIGNLKPSDSGVAFASSWQYAQTTPGSSTCAQTWNGTTLNVDLNMSDFQNPSAP
jgi:hypothetical protein